MERCKRPERSRHGASSTLPTLAPFVERGPEVDGALVRERIGELFSPELLRSIAGRVQQSFCDRLPTIQVLVVAVVHFSVHRLPAFLQVVDRLRLGLVSGVQAVQVTGAALFKRPPASASDNVASVLSTYCGYTLSQCFPGARSLKSAEDFV